MSDLPILLTVIAVRFETFMFVEGINQTDTICAVSLLRTYCISLQFVGLVLVKARLTSERSVIRLARDSNMCIYAWRNRQAIITSLDTCA